MVPQKRRRLSMTELREQENQRQAGIFGSNMGDSRLSMSELREQENQRQAEIFGKNMVESPIQNDSRHVSTNDPLSTAKLCINTAALGSLYSTQAELYHNNSIDNGHAACYPNPSPHSLDVPRSSRISPTDHRQNFDFTMQGANKNRPATTGYTAIPSFSLYPWYGTHDNANGYQSIPSLRQPKSDQRAYALVNPVGDRRYPEAFENASMHPRYDQPCVQTNYHHVTGPIHNSISSEREQLSHPSPQSISELQVTNLASANASFPPQEQGQPAQNSPVLCPRHSPLPSLPTAEHQGTSNRARKFWSKLKASSGIVFASQLQPGQSPSKPIDLPKPRRADRVRKVSCPLCGALFATPNHLQGHFPVCVRRNGNPDGLFWDETLPLKWRRYGKCDTIRADELN